jgi:hypothetical protein
MLNVTRDRGRFEYFWRGRYFLTSNPSYAILKYRGVSIILANLRGMGLKHGPRWLWQVDGANFPLLHIPAMLREVRNRVRAA